MQKYVVCYIFSHDMKEVLLIQKKRPVFLAGQMNGVGGKIEEIDASVLHASQRETLEETNMNLSTEQFKIISKITDNTAGFILTSLYAVATEEQMKERKNNIDEIHEWYNVRKILEGEYPFIYSEGVIESISSSLYLLKN